VLLNLDESIGFPGCDDFAFFDTPERECGMAARGKDFAAIE
jgi:hypothetical protein